ncbi:20289_t:CDS:2 [Gigaspora margarita]|uniref:20289_t:CDS:1 n=1 Tax=Gigaspora margarita TaxID=4874 RepID=A0ABN7UPN5_GIGMA|nr:20289_t:CDS:2 [Gigaspora margarita]
MGQLSTKFKFSRLRLRRERTATANTQSNSEEEGFCLFGGRKFHDLNKDIKYPYPIDDEETDRLHLQHFWTRYIWQSNFSAPIESLLTHHEPTILDIGCGAASWSFEMCTNYPNANIVGLDITIQQATQIKPSNFTFVKANVLDGLPFDDNTFDYVFQRYMFGGYPQEKWPFVISEILRVLKPGGYVELLEPSMMSDIGPATQRIVNGQIAAMGHRGTDPDTSKKLKGYLEKQGMVENIIEEVKACYHGERATSPGISKAAVNNTVGIFVCWKPLLAGFMNVSDKEYDNLTNEARNELAEYDSYFNQVRVYGRKIS